MVTRLNNSRLIPDIYRLMLMRTAVLLCGVFLLAATGAAYANPSGGVVSAGSAGISSAGDTLTVTQTSNRAVIDWQSFNIGTNETTTFVQPSASSMTLNRIGGQDPSQILGTLTANGKIYLVNPNGLVFGKDAQVNVGSLLATTANIRNDDFMAGNMAFTQAGNADGYITNAGTITAAEAGLVGFVAPTVVNNGIITARLGRVSLASGDTLTMDMYGDNLVDVAVSNETAQHLAANGGIIAANGGTVALTAAAGQTIANGIVYNSGIIQADSVAQQNGKIILYAEGSNAVQGNVAADKGKKSGSSTVLVTGTLSATGANAGETGGSITVSGDTVDVGATALIGASGRAGGGDIKIGGDYLGSGDTPAALAVNILPGAAIYNDAVDTGNGGRTIVWSDGTTYFAGAVFARGGHASGNGGFLETSGHEYLDAEGDVDLTAPMGEKGTYFLDPNNITIYGNVDPDYVSTDGSINLASSLVLWLDPSNRSSVTLTYSTDGIAGISASGAAGTNTLTLSSAAAASTLVVGARIRIGSSGTVTTADTLGADTYTIASISGTTITTVESLSSSYSSSTLYRGLASGWADQSAYGNNATASGSAMPLWVSGGLNGLDVLRFDGTSDMMTIADSSSLDGTAGLSIFAVNTPTKLDNATAEAILSKRTDVGTNQSYSLFYYTSNQLNVDVDNNNNRFATSQSYTNGTTNLFGLIYDGSLTSASRVKLYNYGSLIKTAAESSAAIPDYASPLVLGSMNVGDGRYLGATYEDTIIYRSALSADAQALVNQYESAKWNVALSPSGTGATEAAKAMAADGYSVFTTGYLERLSQTANISLQASNNVTLDLQGDNLALDTGRSLTLTAGNQINAVSAGTITTDNADVTMTAANGINLGSVNIATNGGNVSLTTSAGAITANAIAAGTGGDITLTADDMNLNGALSGTGTLTLQPYTASRNLYLNRGSADGTNLNLSTGELSNLSDGWNEIDIGRADGSGSIYMGATTWNDPVVIRNNSRVDTTAGTLHGTGNATVTFDVGSGGWINAGVITTDGTDVSFTGAGVITGGNYITTNGGDITVGNLMISTFPAFTWSTGGGDITINGTITNNPGTPVAAGKVATFNAGSGTVTFGNTVDSDFDMNVTGGTINASAAWGASKALGNVTLTSASSLSLPSITAASIVAKTTGAGADISIASGKTLTATNTGTAITLTSANNFSNAGSLSTPNGRWLVYSADPSLNTFGSLSGDFNRYSCTYGGSCPALGTGNGFLYSITPILTITPTGGMTVTYGATAPGLANYAYGVSGYLSAADQSGDTLSGSLNGSTTYTAGNAAGTVHDISYLNGTLASAIGYGFSYADNASALTVTKAPLDITASSLSKKFGATASPMSFSLSGLFSPDSVSNVTLTSEGAALTAPVGSYAIVASNATGTGLSNYNISYLPGILTVTPSNLSGTLVTSNSAAMQQADQLAQSADMPVGNSRTIIEINEQLARLLGIRKEQRFILYSIPFNPRDTH